MAAHAESTSGTMRGNEKATGAEWIPPDPENVDVAPCPSTKHVEHVGSLVSVPFLVGPHCPREIEVGTAPSRTRGPFCFSWGWGRRLSDLSLRPGLSLSFFICRDVWNCKRLAFGCELLMTVPTARPPGNDLFIRSATN